MIITKSEFQRRKTEIEKYFQATILLDKGTCEILCVDILGQQQVLPIDSDLSRILKANVFLLLYNLVESTITNLIKAIINAVIAEKLTYEELSENLKKLWIKHSISEVKDKSQFGNKLHQLAQKLVEKELLTLSHTCVDISGNIDAQKIRNIAKQIGWKQSKDGRDLVTIKNKRNHLAHGEFTFEDVGKEYPISELINIKDKTIEYLEDVLTKVEDYIVAKYFKFK